MVGAFSLIFVFLWGCRFWMQSLPTFSRDSQLTERITAHEISSFSPVISHIHRVNFQQFLWKWPLWEYLHHRNHQIYKSEPFVPLNHLPAWAGQTMLVKRIFIHISFNSIHPACEALHPSTSWSSSQLRLSVNLTGKNLLTLLLQWRFNKNYCSHRWQRSPILSPNTTF